MDNVAIFAEFGYRLNPHNNDTWDCPACKQAGALFIDFNNEEDVQFTCKNGCSRAMILDAVGVDGNAVVKLSFLPDVTENETVSVENAQTFLDLNSCASFPDFARVCKKTHHGSIPDRWEGVKIDPIAAALGYKITGDRKAYYKPPTVSTSADLLGKKLQPPQFAVEGLLPAGLCIFSAPSKTGKSWLALDLCNSVANGLDFMNRKTNQGDVLYLALEDSEYGLQKRMQKIGCRNSSAFQFAFTVPVVGGGMTEFLTEWCSTAHDPRLIVIDVLQRAKPSGSTRKTAYEQDYDLYAPLNAFALSKGLAIVAITHNRKSNGLTNDDYESISGSVGQMGAAQTAWLITGKRGQKEEKTLRATGRDIREVEDIIHFNPETCRWENFGDAEHVAATNAAASYANNPIRTTLIELLNADSTHTWFGTYDDLWQEIANKTGQYPFDSADKLSKGIRPLEGLLSQNDGILHIRLTNKHNGKYGYHKWYRRKLMEE